MSMKRRVLRLRVLDTPVLVALVLAGGLALACADPSAPASARLTLTAALYSGPLLTGEYARVQFEARNEGPGVARFSGCPTAPSYHVEREDTGAWISVGSVGVVCIAIYSTEHIGIVPHGVLGRWVSVSRAGRYRVRLLVDDDRGGAPRSVFTPAVTVP